MSALQASSRKGGFTSFGLSKNTLRAITDAGFTQPRPIQAKAIPAALKGRDVLGLAQTGTGKTAAFALPIIERLVASKGKNPRALILAPTRELAIQIHGDIESLAKYTNVRAITVFGGVSAVPQKRGLKAHPDIVVACPGRLLDLMGSGDARFDGLEVLVLDEADHMLDMGFLPDIRRILKRLPTPRQNLLFSATMPREIRKLTDDLLHNPQVVELAISAPAETIDHALYPVDQSRKTALLQHLLNQPDFTSAIVFLRTKHRTKRLARDLERTGMRAVALQGNMSQSKRQQAMQGFRKGQYDVLVATDIAARGIDVAGVSHVINYDVPNTPDAYTHRIGRTGRSEKSGQACTFVTGEDYSAVRAIERKLKMQIPRVELNEFSGPGAADISGRRGYRAPRSYDKPKRGQAKRGQARASQPKPSRGFGGVPRSQHPQSGFGAGIDSHRGEDRTPKNPKTKAARRRQRMRTSAGPKSESESTFDLQHESGPSRRSSSRSSRRSARGSSRRSVRGSSRGASRGSARGRRRR